MRLQGCARFPRILQNFSERQILWSLCSVVFHVFTLKLPIQTSLSVVPERPVSLRSDEKCENSAKRAHPEFEYFVRKKTLLLDLTRMHSSRMRTAHSLTDRIS